MIHSYTLAGLPIQTGDILCTMNGKPDILPGEFWRLVGRLVPGDVDHVALYLGPGGRCIEAGALGVSLFEVQGDSWNTEKMAVQRGFLFDDIFGVAYPLEERGFLLEEQATIRQEVAAFCLAQVGKPYNLNFLDPNREDAYYCSQLVYKAYLTQGIDLNTGLSIESLPGANHIIYPQELWSGSAHKEIARHPLTVTT
jgi:hypothetical protein